MGYKGRSFSDCGMFRGGTKGGGKEGSGWFWGAINVGKQRDGDMMACEASNAHLPVWDYRHSLCLLGLHTEPHGAESRGHGHLSLRVLNQVHGQDTD